MSKSKISTLKDYCLAYSLPILWAGVIFFLSDQQALPSFTASILDFIFKKSAHMFVYAVLYVLLFRAYQITNGDEITKKHYFLPIIISLAYALVDEFHQSIIPGRHPTIRDVGYDMLGVLTVLLYQLKLL